MSRPASITSSAMQSRNKSEIFRNESAGAYDEGSRRPSCSHVLVPGSGKRTAAEFRTLGMVTQSYTRDHYKPGSVPNHGESYIKIIILQAGGGRRWMFGGSSLRVGFNDT